MRPILYLEPIGGIAGDMFLAAAIDLGVAVEDLTRHLKGLPVPGWTLQTARASRHALSGTHLTVVLDEAEHHPHRGLPEIRGIIEGASTLTDAMKARALAVFEVLAEAEARVHDVPVERIHFHEVGAIDAIVDICGAAVALELLGDPEVICAPPPLGSGFIRAAHGNMPIPVPATLELLKGLPARHEGVGECTTPTGAALVKALFRVGTPQHFIVERIGYGVGTRDPEDRPNVLRASLGRSEHARAPNVETLVVLEANLDDAPPQLLGHLVDRLLAAGARDAWILPAVMKKGRPGHLLSALAEPKDADTLTRLLFTEGTTLGVRRTTVERHALERRFERVETSHGAVQVKLGLEGGRILNAWPEYEECRRVAEAAGVPLKQVWAEALAALSQRRG